MLLATFKHISSKNADYGAAEQYLTFQHDEFTMKPTLDENGRLIPREDYRISTLNCGDEEFAIACMRANLKYGKNQKREDVKSHHYIISFDPRDGPDHGLTVDRAQEFGKKYCAEYFPGHQAIVCTHPDGHNGSGNIHVHIVINSLRIEEVPFLPYMERPADTKAGCKHRCTDSAMEYFKAELMELCQREGLYQIDLLNGSAERITEREYWAQRKGQSRQNSENEQRLSEGKPLVHTKFETDKAKLRQTIRKAFSYASSFDEFSDLLLQEGISVKESRGRLSYLTPDRTKPITARRLGDDFDKAAVFAVLSENAKQRYTAIHSIPNVDDVSVGYITKHDTPSDRGVVKRDSSARYVTNRYVPTLNSNEGHSEHDKDFPNRKPLPDIQRMVDREAKRAEGKGIAYDRWATVHNLKQMAKTHNFLTENDLIDPDALQSAVDESRASYRQTLDNYKALEAQLKEKTALRQQIINYVKTKPTIEEHRKLSGKKADAYYRAHESDFIIFEAAKRQFQNEFHLKKLPTLKSLNAEINAIVSEKNEAYNEYRAAKEQYDTLSTVQRNAQELYPSHKQTKEKSQER